MRFTKRNKYNDNASVPLISAKKGSSTHGTFSNQHNLLQKNIGHIDLHTIKKIKSRKKTRKEYVKLYSEQLIALFKNYTNKPFDFQEDQTTELNKLLSLIILNIENLLASYQRDRMTFGQYTPQQILDQIKEQNIISLGTLYGPKLNSYIDQGANGLI